MNFFIVEKTSTSKITDHLSSDEFDCKCKHDDCTFTMVYEKTAISFENVRTKVYNKIKKGVVVNSAFRCQRHNKDEKGLKNSRHVRGQAMDLARPKELQMNEFFEICKTEYDVAIVYLEDDFIHCHNNIAGQINLVG